MSDISVQWTTRTMSPLAQKSPALPLTLPLWPEQSRIVGMLTMSVLALNILDAWCTIVWVRMGIAQEANPLLRPLLESSEWSFLAVKMSIVCAGLGFLWQHRDLPMVRVGLAICTAVYGSLAIYHLDIAATAFGWYR